MKINESIAVVGLDVALRENALKNVVMRIVIEIRDRKKKPKLRDFIALYRSKKDQPGAKEEFQKKFKLLYSIDNNGEEDVEDEKFDKLMSNFDRIQRQLT